MGALLKECMQPTGTECRAASVEPIHVTSPMCHHPCDIIHVRHHPCDTTHVLCYKNACNPLELNVEQPQWNCNAGMLIYSFTNSLPVQQETQQGRRVLNNGTGKPVVWRGFRLQAFHTFPLRCPRGIHSDVPLPYRSTAVWEKFSRKTDYAYCAYCMGKVFPEN